MKVHTNRFKEEIGSSGAYCEGVMAIPVKIV